MDAKKQDAMTGLRTVVASRSDVAWLSRKEREALVFVQDVREGEAVSGFRPSFRSFSTNQRRVSASGSGQCVGSGRARRGPRATLRQAVMAGRALDKRSILGGSLLTIYTSSMALSIKSDEADRLARELTAETGETLTEAVEIALRERLDREHARHAASMRTRLARLAADVAALRVADDRTPEGIIGYDDIGLPR
jgi:antitoxin VapB